MPNQQISRHLNNYAIKNENKSCKKNNHGHIQESDGSPSQKAKILIYLVMPPFHSKYQGTPLTRNIKHGNNQQRQAAIDAIQSSLHIEKIILSKSKLDTFFHPKIHLPAYYPYAKLHMLISYNTPAWISHKSHSNKSPTIHQKSFHLLRQVIRGKKQLQVAINRADRNMEIVNSDQLHIDHKPFKSKHHETAMTDNVTRINFTCYVT